MLAVRLGNLCVYYTLIFDKACIHIMNQIRCKISSNHLAPNDILG